MLINFDAGTGVGLDDPTPVAPIGGNTGTTLGQQRQIALLHAASIWARNLRSFVPVEIAVTFAPRTCTATGAVLASAGPGVFVRDFGKWTTHPGHWYPIALANKLGREDFFPAPVGNIPDYDIAAIFNVNLGNPGCLTGVPFYYGLDGNEGPNRIDLVATALHEFGHGFGVTQTVNINPARARLVRFWAASLTSTIATSTTTHRQNVAGDDCGRAAAVDSERPQRGLIGSKSRRRFPRGWLSGCHCSASARPRPSRGNTTSAPPPSVVR